MINILYISIGSFWNNACMKNYQHHDLLFKYINKMCEPVSVKIGVPVQGPSHLSKLLSGNGNQLLQQVWRDHIDFEVSGSLYEGDYDCMVINGSENFQDIELPSGEILEGDFISNWVINKAAEALSNNKRVLLFDQDNYINEKLGSKDTSNNLAFNLFNKFKKDKGFYLSGPFEYGHTMDNLSSMYNDYVFIPFVVDPNEVSSVKPKSERTYFAKYAGNNYHRDNFIPLFIECSKYGKVLVNGSGWKDTSRKLKEIENIQFKPKFPLTYEKVNDYYSDSIIGLYGTTNIESFRKHGHYTLRIREFYQAGVPIVCEDLDYLTDSISPDCLPVESQIKLISELPDDSYEKFIECQRYKIEGKFSAVIYSKLLHRILRGI